MIEADEEQYFGKSGEKKMVVCLHLYSDFYE